MRLVITSMDSFVSCDDLLQTSRYIQQLTYVLFQHQALPNLNMIHKKLVYNWAKSPQSGPFTCYQSSVKLTHLLIEINVRECVEQPLDCESLDMPYPSREQDPNWRQTQFRGILMEKRHNWTLRLTAIPIQQWASIQRNNNTLCPWAGWKVSKDLFVYRQISVECF